MSEPNVLFAYLYRDASNCKKVGISIFANPEQLTADEITERLTAGLNDSQWFIADQINVPEVFLFPEYEVNDNDHCWHEFWYVEPTAIEPTDERTMAQLVGEVETIGALGWKEFDPIKRTKERLAAARGATAAQPEARS